MRLYDTPPGSCRSCRRRPGPIRMYFCGPTVYQRIHIGNARPFVISMWLQALARAHGLRRDARREHHRHQRQDLRGRAGREREARRRGERVVRRGHRRPRPRPAGRRAEGDRVDPGDRRDDRAARRDRATPTRPGATSTSASRASRTTAGSRAATATRRRRATLRGGRGGGAEGGSARLRALEGAQAGRGHVVGLAVGPRPARAGTSSARRWRRSTSGRCSRSTAAGST